MTETRQIGRLTVQFLGDEAARLGKWFEKLGEILTNVLLGKLRHCAIAILHCSLSVTTAQLQEITLDVAEATAVHNPVGGEMTILVTLTPQSSRTFADFTAKYVLRDFEIRMTDQVLVPVIRLLSEIDNGVMYITLRKRSDDEVAELARRLSSRKEKIR